MALSIGSFLAGLGLSALLFGQWVRNDFKRAQKAIVFMQLVVLLYAFFVCADLDFLPRLLNLISRIAANGSWGYSASINLLIFLFLFIPAFCLGGAFPIFNGLYARALDRVTADTGKVYFWDIAGSVAGCLITSFILIPSLGIRPTIILAMLTSLLLIVLIKPYSRKIAAICTAAACALLYQDILYKLAGRKEPRQEVNFTRFPRFGGKSLEAEYFGSIIFQKESPYGTVTVGRIGGIATLYINLRAMCSDDKEALTEKLLGSVAADNINKGSSVLNIGLGCGRTASVLSHHKNVSKLLAAEINPAVRQAYDQAFAKIFPLRDNQRTSIEIADGANILREGGVSFDAIVIDIEEVDIIYSSPLYTLEYMKMARARLKPGGVFAIWTFSVNNNFLKVLYNTMQHSFPRAEILMLRQDSGAVVMYGSDKDIKINIKEPLRAEEIRQIKNTKNDLVNTLERPALQRYYDSYRNFELPEIYKERYMRRNEH